MVCTGRFALLTVRALVVLNGWAVSNDRHNGESEADDEAPDVRHPAPETTRQRRLSSGRINRSTKACAESTSSTRPAQIATACMPLPAQQSVVVGVQQ